MLKHGLSIAAAALLGVRAGAQAQDGFFDFSKIPGLDAQPTVTLDLTPGMLAFVSGAARATDPGAADLLAGIRGARIYVYESLASRDAADVKRFIDDTAGKLENQGWHRAVFVQDDDGDVRVYVKLGDPAGPTPAHLNGLTVMVAGDGGEAVFVNLDAQIDPAQIGRLAAEFGPGGKLGGLAGLGQPSRTSPPAASARSETGG